MEEFSVDVATLSVGPRLVAAKWTELWMVGAAIALEPPLVALVGTRGPDAQGLRMAHRLSEALAKAGITVVSGGALGIDAAAHSAALGAEGRTVVVLPSGLKNPYPLRHRALFRRVVERGGVVLSPFPPRTPPAHWTFPRRNELLAALCDLLVVVQAPRNSGSLLAAEAARALGRRVLAVPASPGDPRGAGCVELLRSGAEMCASEEDLLAAIARRDGPLLPQKPAQRASASPTKEQGKASRTRARVRDDAAEPPGVSTGEGVEFALEGDGRIVLGVLTEGGQHPDELAAKTGLTASQVRSSLSMLVLLGLAFEQGGGCFARR